ncbi:MAG: hypothetical protein JWP74_3668 [Marmoricola sp.]|nr:hypothetical protein [Marmoricola sp.]
MLKAIAFGLGCGAGVEAWKNFPPDGPVTTRPLALVFIVGLLCAYLGGRWHGRGHVSASATAVAVANASATAQQAVNLVVMTGGGAAPGRGVQVPSEAVSWFEGERVQVTEADLDGMDLSELLSESPEEIAP